MQVSEERIEEFKKIMEKQSGKEVSRQEAYEGAQNLANFAELLYKLARKEMDRKRRLKTEPDGFPVDGNYNCLVCHQYINESNGWYDWYGQTCLTCRRAIKEKIIPTFVCTARDSFYSISSLNYTFGIKHQTAKKMIRESKLFPRIVLNENGSAHEHIFLKKENPNLVDPKPVSRAWKAYKRQTDKRSRRRTREESKKLAKELRDEWAKTKAKYKLK